MKQASAIFSFFMLLLISGKSEAQQPAVDTVISRNSSGEATDCLVHVRVVSGSERAPSDSAPHVEMHTFLSDVSDQLEPLPFSKYRPIGDNEKRLKLDESGMFQVVDDEGEMNILSVVPHRIEHGKVHMTVDWRGPGAERLLSAKVRVLNGRDIVVGAENRHDNSTILCINVNCE